MLWPLVAGYLVVRNEKDIRLFIGRLRKGKLLGQEIELDSSLKELDRQVHLVQQQPVEISTPPVAATREPDLVQMERSARDNSETLADEIYNIAAKSPTLALMQLASEIEKISNRIWVDLDDGKRPSRPSVRQLIDGLTHVLPKAVPSALRSFWNVRNSIVHGREAEDQEVLSAIDSGLSLWKALDRFASSYVEVVRSRIPIYSDADGTQLIPDATGVEVKSGPGNTIEFWATTRSDYQPQDILRPNWDFSRVFPKTWYRDPVSGAMISVFDEAANFVGEPIQVNLGL